MQKKRFKIIYQNSFLKHSIPYFENRIITDDVMIKMKGSDVSDLAKEGISVRTDNSGKNLMHNKFVIIDNDVLMTGSYNWTQ